MVSSASDLVPIQPGASGARRPRVAMRVNGVSIEGLVSFDVTRNAYFAADTFAATVALDGTGTGYGAPFWALTETITLELFAAVADPAATLAPAAPAMVSLITGRVDEVDIDYQAQTLRLSGRDFSSNFIDTKTTEKFVNLTASAIAELLAARHGMTAVVDQTTTLAGDYYGGDHVTLTDETTEWQLLAFLAQAEGFDLFVSGTELHFTAPADATQIEPFTIRYAYGDGAGHTPQANVPRIGVRRALTLANDVIVTVVSWNSGAKAAQKVRVKAQKAKKSQEYGGTSQTYVFRVPGLTRDQMVAFGQRKLEEISQHERILDVGSLPGDPRLTPRRMLRLVGTNTDFDQDYYMNAVTFHADFGGGFSMSVSGKNHSPQTEVSL